MMKLRREKRGGNNPRTRKDPICVFWMKKDARRERKKKYDRMEDNPE